MTWMRLTMLKCVDGHDDVDNVDGVDIIDNVDDINVIDNSDDVENNNKMECYECNAMSAML